MILFNTSFIRKIVLFLSAAALSISAMAAPDFNQMQRLANQGNIDAQYNLGVMYSNGEGVLQDYSKAKEWYIKAANQSDAKSQYNLGIMYFNGEGVRQNNVVAKEWFGRSCDNGLQLGCDAYQLLN